MKIALIGYGKMGRAIEEVALEKGHEIVLKIHSKNRDDMNASRIRQADVCIEFSTPQTAFANVKTCLEAGVPVVCGTTAWLEHLAEAGEIANREGTGFLYASNFSIGVNLFFRINEFVARLMAPYNSYRVEMEEIHHTAKKDAPSGTAITLAEGILDENGSLEKWVNTYSQAANELPIISKREDPAPGTHIVHYHSSIDSIEIKHTAHSRMGFAYGAVLAAEFIAGKKGIFTMKDVLGS